MTGAACRNWLSLVLLTGTSPAWSATLTVPLDSMVIDASAPADADRQHTGNRTVLTAEQLQRSGLVRSQDLARHVPSLLLSDPNPRYASYGLRGLGASGFNDGLDSSVAVYLDDIYLGRVGMALLDFADMESIEVLRGPQGTRGGRNSTAGAIRFNSRRPSLQPRLETELSLGESGARQVRASAASALAGDVLAGSVSFFDVQRDGEIANVRDGHRYNDQDRQGVRGQLLYAPNEQSSMRLIVDHVQESPRAAVLASAHYSAQTRKRAAFVGYPLLNADPSARRIDQDYTGVQQTYQSGLALEWSHLLDSGTRLTSITGYRDWRYESRQDGDNLGLAIATSDVRLDQHQFSQEIRLDGALGEQVSYRVGTYYLRQHLNRGLDVGFGADAAAFFIGDRPEARLLGVSAGQVPPSLLEGARQQGKARQLTDSSAVFGELTWRLSERLSVTPGLRLTHERKRAEIERHVTDLAPLGADPVSRLGGQLLRDVALGQDYRREESIDASDLSGQLVFSYELADDVHAYIGWTRGFKGGGANLDVVGGRVPSTYASERASSWEAGLHGQFWQQRLELDLALYQADVRNYQALTTSPPADLYSPPLRDNLINIDKVRMRGVELDTRLHPTERLDLRLALAWNDARYRDFKNGPCSPESAQWGCDLSGQRLFNAPEWSLAAGAEQRFPLGKGNEVFAALDYSWRSGYQGSLEGGAGSAVPAYGLADVRLGIRQARAGMEFVGWVRNLFDAHYLTAVSAQLGAGDYAVLPGEPRTAGVTVIWRH
ncbi:TonB-dependent receptor [Pseudomonas capeferrum]|uniref:TonB-dependent receptor n=1 Tax=Pseudomonas capeferrum TaxID=1495066 RepID=UPI0015E44D3B|nr:TonB-dependent receptor [Pseudomonas capeferrum]MBA1205351.1 TonB-dependent receptor [Pseudomonas capeferrum]